MFGIDLRFKEVAPALLVEWGIAGLRFWAGIIIVPILLLLSAGWTIACMIDRKEDAKISA